MKIIVISIVLITGLFCSIFSFYQEKLQSSFEESSNVSTRNFFLLLGVFLALSGAFSYIPVTFWLFSIMGVGIFIFSNFPTALLSIGTCIALTTLLADKGIAIFLLYFLASGFTLMLFHNINASVKLYTPLFMSISAQIVVLLCIVLFQTQQGERKEAIIFAILQIILTILLEILILKRYYYPKVWKEKDIFQKINQLDYAVLQKAKENNESIFHRIVAIANLCEYIQKELDIFYPEVQTAAYYSYIGQAFFKEPDLNYYMTLCEEEEFPKAAKELIIEIQNADEGIYTLKAAIVIIANCIVTGFLENGEKNKVTSIQKQDLEYMIQENLETKINNGLLKHCDISFQQITKMKEILLKETLYYDILR